MFRPNLWCHVRRKTGRDLFGQAAFGNPIKVPCAVVHLQPKVEDTAVRADSSASRGVAEETVIQATLLFPVSFMPILDDIISISGLLLEVSFVEPRYRVTGMLDHYEVKCTLKESVS